MLPHWRNEWSWNVEDAKYSISIHANHNDYSLYWKGPNFNNRINICTYIVFSSKNYIKPLHGKFICSNCNQVSYFGRFPEYDNVFLDYIVCSKCHDAFSDYTPTFKNGAYEVNMQIPVNNITITRVAIQFIRSICGRYDFIYHVDATVPKKLLFEDCGIHNCLIYANVSFDGHKICRQQKLKILNEELAIFRWILIESDNFPIDVIDIIIKLYYNIINIAHIIY